MPNITSPTGEHYVAEASTLGFPVATSEWPTRVEHATGTLDAKTFYFAGFARQERTIISATYVTENGETQLIVFND